MAWRLWNSRPGIIPVVFSTSRSWIRRTAKSNQTKYHPVFFDEKSRCTYTVKKKKQNEEVKYSDRAKQTNNSWWMTYTLKKEERLRTRLPVRQTPVYSLHCCCCYIPEKDDDYYYMNVWQPARRRERRTEITSTTHHLLDKTICRFIYST